MNKKKADTTKEVEKASFFVGKGSRLSDMAKFALFSAFYFLDKDLSRK